jgi:hypothetical protein
MRLLSYGKELTALWGLLILTINKEQMHHHDIIFRMEGKKIRKASVCGFCTYVIDSLIMIT